MLNSVLSFFNKISSDEILELKKPNATNIIYKDEPRKKPSPKKLMKDKFLEVSEPLLKKEEQKLNGGRSLNPEEEKEGIRIKVVMTKEEAARLLSKCKDGGVLEYKDLACQLNQIPKNRVSIVPLKTGS